MSFKSVIGAPHSLDKLPRVHFPRAALSKQYIATQTTSARGCAPTSRTALRDPGTQARPPRFLRGPTQKYTAVTRIATACSGKMTVRALRARPGLGPAIIERRRCDATLIPAPFCQPGHNRRDRKWEPFHAQIRGGWAAARHRYRPQQRRGPDARLDERRGARPDGRHGAGPFLDTLARPHLEEGRGQR